MCPSTIWPAFKVILQSDLRIQALAQNPETARGQAHAVHFSGLAGQRAVDELTAMGQQTQNTKGAHNKKLPTSKGKTLDTHTHTHTHIAKSIMRQLRGSGPIGVPSQSLLESSAARRLGLAQPEQSERGARVCSCAA